ncbi:hypothetical protein CWI75_07915 [Kineobactrum sediminis]|uniref:Uncharacterized protein n=1 Tax=Kineobactrum sediminis TaxID=1905677 RepID=A0A2N5Y4I8_9GAMM|nr:hypothetical protein [Kineobactrum sediminis]PLW83316.1 hypothetical protein CWI75_07915 [Kineobactrum sediminis]
MALPAHTRQQRLTVELDTRVALEAVLVTALHRIPTARRQDWLRRLLLEGFRSECLGLRHALIEVPAPATAPLQGVPVSPGAAAEPAAAGVPTGGPRTVGPQTTKPLAHLRKLIG